MTATARQIAILRADTMVGSDFILPVLFKRVLQDGFPKTENVYALMREGGFTVEIQQVEIDPTVDMSDALEAAFREMLAYRPVFVDTETGRVFVTRSMGGGCDFVAEDGNLFEAFGLTLPESTDGLYQVVYGSRIRMMRIAIIRQACPNLSVDAIRAAIHDGGAVTMTRREVARTLLAALAQSAMRHRDITNGRITNEFGCYTPADIITVRQFA